MTPPMTPREKVEPLLDDLLRQAVETMKSWTPEQREAHFEAQKKAWLAAEMAFGDEGTRVVTALASGSGDHAELARLAEACGGKVCWTATRTGVSEHRNVSFYIYDGATMLAETNGDTPQIANFIAAANPAAVLALLAENAALRGERDRAKERMHQAIDKARDEEIAAQNAELRATEAERKLAEAVGLLRRWRSDLPSEALEDLTDAFVSSLEDHR